MRNHAAFLERLDPRRRRRGAVVATLAFAASVGVGAGAGTPLQGSGSWLTYGGTPTRESVQTAGPPLRPLRMAWRSATLRGPIYGEPLVWSGRIYVATEADVVYGLDARTGVVAWRRTLGVPVPAGALPCGDIAPSVGVTSTMVLDAARAELFVSAALTVHGRVRHELFALDPGNGRVRWRRDLDLPGADPAALLQRAALALDRGRVLVGFGGNYGDCAAYRGTVVAVGESGRGPLHSYVVPTVHGGAIWAPAGLAVDGAGHVFAATGNGASTGRYDGGDSVFELSATLALLGTFAPANWRALNAGDLDLGSNAPMLLPGSRALIVGKNAIANLLSTVSPAALARPLASVPACFSIGGDAYLAPLAYVACPDGALTALRVGPGSLRVVWRGPPGTSGSPTVAGGLVWVLGGGELRGLAPATGRQLVTVPVISTTRYVAPSAAEGLLVVGGTTCVEAFAGPRGWQP